MKTPADIRNSVYNYTESTTNIEQSMLSDTFMNIIFKNGH